MTRFEDLAQPVINRTVPEPTPRGPNGHKPDVDPFGPPDPETPDHENIPATAAPSIDPALLPAGSPEQPVHQ